MLALQVLFVALFGLALGSFLNVCIVRLPRGASIAYPPSRCFSCAQPLRAIDNVPLFSWILLRGRSRCCSQPIPIRYPIVELSSGLLLLGCFFAFGITPAGFGMALLAWLLLGLAWMDAETFLLPDAFTVPGVALGISYQIWIAIPSHTALAATVSSALSALLLAALLLAVALCYRWIRHRDGMGMGDVKLAAMLGAWLGWKIALVSIFLAIVFGAAAGIAMLLTQQRHRQTTNAEAGGPLRLPFGTFLSIAALITIFVGRSLLDWYLRFYH